MNYLALAGSILAGLVALRAFLIIWMVSTGKKDYEDFGFLSHGGVTTVFGTLAVWLFGMVAA